MKNLSIVLLLSIFISSCHTEETTTVKSEDLPFFDLKAYFKKEKKRLATRSNFKKTTKVNQKEEVKEVKQLNFEEELRIFQESDINRPAWYGKYQIDSVFQGKDLQTIRYTPKEMDLEIKLIQVNFENEEVSKIQINRALKTALADTDHSLIYEPKKGYQINNSQEMKIGDSQFFEVKVDF